MPESRDRLSRPADITAMFSRRRQSIGGIAIRLDEPEVVTRTPIRLGSTGMTETRGPTGLTATRGSLRRRRARNWRRRNMYGTPAASSENVMGSGRSGRGGSASSVLPSWYPRTPLRDITAIVRAIERRRACLRETEGQQTESPVPQDQNVLSPSVPISGAELEHDFPTMTPDPAIGKKPFPLSVGKVPKILLDITNQNAGESSDCLTPQKKLLNSIDTVEKVVMEELKKLKRTPNAKKVEREKRVRTLMSMR
ncbi:uv-b-insensitive 4 [Actinidia rufa]|uniref:Uv-b-insensitive 4 n=1 Tax=Actinidia rufa TaxID=165716 RepID=A0A7J0FC47_9ERIC|nr:uv-b-insensitive 4 [Actinidia rufa]